MKAKLLRAHGSQNAALRVVGGEIWKGKRGLLWTLVFCSNLFVLLITDLLLIASFLLRTVCVCAKYCRKMSYTCIHTHSDKGRK